MSPIQTIINNPDETRFESHIADFLASCPLYNSRTSFDFDIATLCDPEMLQRFIEQGQPDSWRRLINRYQKKAMAEVIKEFNAQLDFGVGLLKLLREGFTLQGIKIKLLQFKPDQARNLAAWELYEKNCFSAVRQMRYSNQGNDTGRELDLVILINGIPFITCELKNEFTGQNIIHGMEQYRTSRDKNNRFLRNCLVHFVVDNNKAMMTTRLRNEETNFLPFNKDTNNPVVDGKYATHYIWEEVFQADSLLNILQNFIRQYIPRKEKNRITVFPRYHQIGCVRKIMGSVITEGTGHNYLIQHSAGSGKSMSIAWLAHQLSDLHDLEDKPVFDSIIVVTDRIILDASISDQILDFETTAGVVKSVKKGSQSLATALEDGYRIIITTIQKFSNARTKINELSGHRFAVIIDEAHSSQNGENAKDLRLTLTPEEVVKSMIVPEDIEGLDDIDTLLTEIQAANQLANAKYISYFAFTATPKKQTLGLFGRNGEAFDTYTMRQAIEEGFILDVLENYTTFKSLFELIKKEEGQEEDAEDELKQLYEKKKALKLMMKYVNENPYVITYKADLMLKHFMDHTIHKIGGKAKAMVVTGSRADAVRYKLTIDRLIKEKYNDEIKTLVAFSGEVAINEEKYTEENMNGFGVKDAAIREKFKQSNFKLLIVANKFQTGFDQTLLHTMYVDKQLGGVQAIQTLSRLNRCHPGKQDTMVIDFVNEHEEIEASFQPYYQFTHLIDPHNTQKLYDYKREIDDYKVFNMDQVNDAVRILIDPNRNPESLSPLFKRIVEERVAPMEKEDKAKYRQLINRYIRQYAFLSQLMTFTDADLEKYYLFCKLLYKYLPYTKETLPLDILERINLDKFKVEERENGSILLQPEDGDLRGGSNDRVGAPKPGDMESLKQLLKEVNEPYKGFLAENDKLIYSILLEVLADPEIQKAFNAQNTVDVLMELVKNKFSDKGYEKVQVYLNLLNEMQKNQTFTESFFRKTFEFMAAATTKGDRPEYDENRLKELIINTFGADFAEIAGKMYRHLEEVVDWLFIVLNTNTIDSLDGQNEQIKEILNRLYLGENRLVDLQIFLKTLSTTYEAFLRKIYFLIHGEEISATGMVNVIYKFQDIQKLYVPEDKVFNKDPRLANMSAYYNLLYALRNDQAHMAPASTEQEVNAALHAVVGMFIYAVMVNITEIETAMG